MLYGGTSGYSFREWVGHFYAPKTSSKKYLAFYASRLTVQMQVVEILNRVEDLYLYVKHDDEGVVPETALRLQSEISS